MTDEEEAPRHAQLAAAKAATKTDAKNRAGRTFLQGLLVTAVVAAAATANGIVTVWTGDDVTHGGAWIALGTSCVVSVLTAATSYVARLKVPPAQE